MIIGTAGHIDHGKTSLMRALTGIDTDRLKEEKARGITIDLGFAYVPLPGGGTLGFVDVPGHERLVHTMIAGAASIDLALLVVAADDGVMPQTREHLQILSLLGIRDGLVALTKADLVEPDRLAEIEAQISALLAGTRLTGAEVMAVSCATGAGIAALRQRLLAAAERPRPHAEGGAFRLAVDRSFTLAGAGTVVTGSVVAGEVRVGSPVLLLPGGQRARVRALHAGNRPAECGYAGERCALNLAGPGIHSHSIGRGGWVVEPGQEATTQRCDVDLHLLGSERDALRHWTPVHLHHGAGQVAARVVLLEPERLRPGEMGLAQLVLEQPLPLRHGDRLVLRDTSAQRTIAGGRVLDPGAPDRHRRRPARLALLQALRAEPRAEALRQALSVPPFLRLRGALLAEWGLTAAGLEALLPGLRHLPDGGAGQVATEAGLSHLVGGMVEALAAFHAARPAVPGMAAEALRLAMPGRLPREGFGAVLGHALREGSVVQEAHLLRLPAHHAGMPEMEARLWDRVRPMLEGEQRFRPPRLRDMAAAIGTPEVALRRACKLFSRSGLVMELAPDHFFLRAAVLEMAQAVRALSEESGGSGFAAAQFRDRLGNGRQLAIQILEYFDRRGITLRRGDLRRAARDPALVFGSAGPAG